MQTEDETPPQLLTVAELAQRLRISRPTAYRLIAAWPGRENADATRLELVERGSPDGRLADTSVALQDDRRRRSARLRRASPSSS